MELRTRVSESARVHRLGLGAKWAYAGNFVDARSMARAGGGSIHRRRPPLLGRGRDYG